MEHEQRHRKIRGKMVLLLVLNLLLLPLMAECRTLRGCEEELSPIGKTVEEKKRQNLTSREEQEDLLTFTLLHVNDIHSHFEEVNVNTGTCKVKLSSSQT